MTFIPGIVVWWMPPSVLCSWQGLGNICSLFWYTEIRALSVVTQETLEKAVWRRNQLKSEIDFMSPNHYHWGWWSRILVCRCGSGIGSRGGHSHKLGYAYARTARVWFLPISVLERVGFFGHKCVLERVAFFKEFVSTMVIFQLSGGLCQFLSGIQHFGLHIRNCVNLQ